MTVRELLIHPICFDVVEIRDFEGKNLFAYGDIEDLDRFYDCEVKDYSLNDDYESFYVLKIFI